MTRWEQIKCSLGFHDWGKWRHINIEMIDPETKKFAYELTAQVRNCHRCNLQEKHHDNSR
jgi:hypothetical protein